MDQSVCLDTEHAAIIVPALPTARLRARSDAIVELSVSGAGRSLSEASAALRATQAAVDWHLHRSLSHTTTR